jgi:integrase
VVKLPLPDPLPFSELELEPRISAKYYATFELGSLLASAKEQLAATDPEAFKIFLLAGLSGLRRKEIDLLPWTAFGWATDIIRVEHTAYFSPKTPDSTGDVAVDHELMDLFRQYRAADPNAVFVIESSGSPESGGLSNHYRCEAVFERLTEWLRSQGIKSAKPIHELRKAFGSAICEKAGIHQASRSLRHSDIRVTSQVYVDSRSRISVGLGHLLTGET